MKILVTVKQVPDTSGKVAVVLCFIILLAVALTHLPGKEEKA